MFLACISDGMLLRQETAACLRYEQVHKFNSSINKTSQLLQRTTAQCA